MSRSAAADREERLASCREAVPGDRVARAARDLVPLLQLVDGAKTPRTGRADVGRPQRVGEDGEDIVGELDRGIELQEQRTLLQEQRAFLRKVIDLTGGTPELKRQLANSLLNTGEFTEAADLLKELVKTNAQDPGVKTMMARAQIGARQFSEAIESLKSQVASNPDDVEALFYLGSAYEQSGQAAEAIKIFSKLVDEARSGPAR